MKQGPVEEREVEEFGESGSQAKLRHQTKNIEIDTDLSDTSSLDSTNDRAWDVEALTSWLYFSRSGVDGSLHSSALLNLQTDPVILAKTPYSPNLIVREHVEQTGPHLVEGWPPLQGPQGRVVEDSRFSMKF